MLLQAARVSPRTGRFAPAACRSSVRCRPRSSLGRHDRACTHPLLWTRERKYRRRHRPVSEIRTRALHRRFDCALLHLRRLQLSLFSFSACRCSPNSQKSGHPFRFRFVGHKPTSAASFDHLVGAGEQRGRDGNAERLRCFQINSQHVSGRCLHRQSAGFSPLRMRST